MITIWNIIQIITIIVILVQEYSLVFYSFSVFVFRPVLQQVLHHLHSCTALAIDVMNANLFFLLLSKIGNCSCALLIPCHCLLNSSFNSTNILIIIIVIVILVIVITIISGAQCSRGTYPAFTPTGVQVCAQVINNSNYYYIVIESH